ncbi:protein kinase [Plasmodium brasilianum]|uniref:Protein kinase, putative n=2 Tax=Plasmodium (Plasmodium) TaxID=418103 RepID=A0A1A8W5J1_PLAMA|nr:protein kinase, putative [Plasmodium malariae]KAI4836462.1 protein kinase [Plasmodium brasilianum]SBS88043.1 protein kinase, putative [Plasmodium malariae]SCO93740.1 protein kinase, putative [Plasmodium malariae]
MSKWSSLKSKIVWPNEFVYVIENEGYDNKYGHSYIVKYNGNIVHKNFKKRLHKVEKLLKVTNNICQDLEEKNNQYDSDGLEYDNNVSEEINNANQILLRLNDKKEFINDKLSKINTIDEKYDIIIKEEPCYIFRLDLPYLNVEEDYLIASLKKKYFHEYYMNRKKKGNHYSGKNKSRGKEKEKEKVKEYKTYLYNIKIMECEESIVGNREFIFSEANSEHLKINTLINEGKSIRSALYEYKGYCLDSLSDEEDNEEDNEADDKGTHPNNGQSPEQVRKKEEQMNGQNKKEITYETLCILPYCDIIKLKKKEFNTENTVAGFLTPYLLNGNVRKYIENIHQYIKYKIDDEIILKNLTNIIKLMAFLKEKSLFHGNIKPSNLFISNNGLHLLIGNFIPKLKLLNYYFYVIHMRRKIPRYISPELLAYLKKKRIISKSRMKQNKHIDKFFFKNDVFCLGLSFYYIITMKEDILYYIDNPHVFQFNVDSAQSFITRPELFFLLKHMLTYEHKQRPDWPALAIMVNQIRGSRKLKGN